MAHEIHSMMKGRHCVKNPAQHSKYQLQKKKHIALNLFQNLGQCHAISRKKYFSKISLIFKLNAVLLALMWKRSYFNTEILT